MDYVDSEVLIPLVESRPALYDRQLKDYRDRNVKQKLWVEICEIMVKEWGKLSPEEKVITGEKIQKRWSSLRTSFKREYNVQRNTTFVLGQKKRRKYEYYDQLLFLLPTLSDSITTSNDSELSDELVENIVEINNDSVATVYSNVSQMDDDLAENIVCNIKCDTVPSVSTPPPVDISRTSERPPDQPIVRNKSKKSSYEERLLKILKEEKKEAEQIDEDKNFLMSLIPSFKRMNNSQKLRTKIRFLQAISDVETQQSPVVSVRNSVRKRQLRGDKRESRSPL